jgi:hypothetical protein
VGVRAEGVTRAAHRRRHRCIGRHPGRHEARRCAYANPTHAWASMSVEHPNVAVEVAHSPASKTGPECVETPFLPRSARLPVGSIEFNTSSLR